LARLTGYRATSDADQVRELQGRLQALKATDMALIVSPGQNEMQQLAQLGLDIVPHRKRMNEEPLDEKFKDSKVTPITPAARTSTSFSRSCLSLPAR
jgi:type I restriction enzyme R subunit